MKYLYYSYVLVNAFYVEPSIHKEHFFYHQESFEKAATFT